MKRNLQVKVLHLTEGLPQLGGRMSLSSGFVVGGPHQVENIERIPGGYLVLSKGRLFAIGEARVVVAEVEDLDAIGAQAQVGATAAKAEEVEPVAPAPPPAPALPGDIMVDARGVYSRVPLEASGPAEAAEANTAEVSPEVHAFKPKHRRQGPTPAEK